MSSLLTVKISVPKRQPDLIINFSTAHQLDRQIDR